MIGGVRVSWTDHILHPSRKVTTYSLTVSVFFAADSRENGHTEFRVCSLLKIHVIQAKAKSNGKTGYKSGQ